VTHRFYRMRKFIKNKRLVRFLPFLVFFESTYYGHGKKYSRKHFTLIGIALFFYAMCVHYLSILGRSKIKHEIGDRLRLIFPKMHMSPNYSLTKQLDGMEKDK